MTAFTVDTATLEALSSTLTAIHNQMGAALIAGAARSRPASGAPRTELAGSPEGAPVISGGLGSL